MPALAVTTEDTAPRATPANQPDAGQAVMRYVRGIRKRWKTAIAIMLASLLVGVLVIIRAVPVYESSSLLQIENRSPEVLDVANVNPENWINDYYAVNTLVELLRTRDMAKRVAADLNLAAGTSFFEKMRVEFEEAGSAQQRRTRREQFAIGLLRQNLIISPREDSRVILVGFQSPDPSLAASVANAYARAAVQAEMERSVGTTSFARDFLETRLAEARARLEDSERAAIGYARAAGLVNVAPADMAAANGGADDAAVAPSLGASTLASVNAAYAAARVKRLEQESRWRLAQSSSLGAQATQNPAVQPLVNARAEASAEYESQLATRTPDHPEMVRLANKLREIDRNIAAETQKYRNSIRAEFETARLQEAALQAELEARRANSLDEQEQNVQLGLLRREVDTNRSLYDALLQRYREVSAASGSYTSAIAIADTAEVPGWPISPNVPFSLLVALGIGFVLAIAVVLVLEFLDDVIHTPAELDQRLGLPAVGAVPKWPAEPTIADLSDPQSDLAEAYMSIRTALGYASARGHPKPLLVTSTRAGEGKSTTAIGLSLAFARGNKRVLLIDADLRQPSLGRNLGINAAPGLSDVLSGQRELHEGIKTMPELGIDVMSAGARSPDPAGLLSGDRLAPLLEAVGRNYDVVIVDAPPVMGIADAAELAARSDGVLFVVEAGGARSPQIQMALNRLRAAGGRLIGGVTTMFDPKTSGYGAAYEYAAHYRYEKAA